MSNDLTKVSSSDFYRKKLHDLQASWMVTYQGMASDFAFASGGKQMWERSVISQRSGRPTISIPLIQPYVDRIVAPTRVHPPGMAVRTEDKGVESLINGLIRGIERASSATDAYANALKCAVTGGLGWLYLSVEKDHENLVLRIKSTLDPTAIMIDPTSTCIDGSDAQYACYRGFMGKSQAVREFGPEAANNPIENGISQMTYNLPQDTVLDCIWYTIEKGGMRITRTVGEKEVYNQFFERVSYLPVVPVIGEQLFGSDGRRYGGLVRRAKDINTSINITASNVMELVAMAPKSPWIVASESVENYKVAWETANTENHAYLPFKHKDKDGEPLPVPQRLDNSPQTQALQGVAEYFMSLLGKVTGISDAMLGGLETAQESGKSLIARMEAAEGASSQYLDHLMSSITQLARVLIEMVPLVYEGNRSLVLIDDNGNSTRVRGDVRQLITNEILDMLDVDVESGPQMELQRKRASEALSQIIQSAGDKSVALLDLWADTQNLPNATEVKNRIKKMLPPELTMGEGEGEESANPQMMQMMQQVQQQMAEKDTTIQTLEGYVSQLQAQVNSQQQIYEMEMRKAEIQAEVTLQKTQMEIASRKEIELLKSGSEDMRLATKLSAEQEKQVADIIAKMMLKNQEAVHAVDHKVLDLGISAAKLPGYVQDDVAKAKENVENFQKPEM